MKIIRTSTVPGSLNIFCRGLLRELQEQEGYEVIAVSSPGKELDEIRSREGVKTYAVKMKRHISPFQDLLSLWELIKVFRKERPQLVHSITPKAGLLSMLAAWICRVPVRLHTFTGLVFPTAKGLRQKVLISTDRLTCACATHVVPEGEGVRRDLIKYKITNKTLEVLGYGNVRGIDLKYYDRTPEVMKLANEIRKHGVFTFIFVGRLVGDKGVNELVTSFRELNKKYPDTRLILVGPQEEALAPLSSGTLAEIRNNPAIEAVGRQDDVRPWMAAADVFVLPSYREGFPNVVIEAGAMGIPSIVTDINGSNEIIVDGKNGIVVPPRQVESLSNAMEALFEDRNLVSRLSVEARKFISMRYEQSFVRGCLKKYYREILQNIKY